MDGINTGVQQYVQQAANYLDQIQNQQQTVCTKLYEQGINALELAELQIALSRFEKMMQLGCREKLAAKKYRETLSLIGVDSLRLVARQHFSRGELLPAKNTFQRVLQLSPADSEALAGLRNCETRIQTVSEDHFRQGMKYYVEENYESAIMEWKQVLTFRPNHEDARNYIQKARKRLEALQQIH